MLQDSGEPRGSSITMNERYRIGEFARRTGVTVRALWYYDRIGLLRPTGRSGTGYRWYEEGALSRLQQIVTLKELGFNLTSISAFLDADDFDISATLDEQIGLFEERSRRIAVVIAAMRSAIAAIAHDSALQRNELVHVIKATLTMNDIDFTPHFTAEQLAALKERSLSPDDQRRISAAWEQLFADIEAAATSDPAGETARALLARWDELIAAFTQNDPAMENSLGNLYAASENRAKANAAMPGMATAWAFIERVRAEQNRP